MAQFAEVVLLHESLTALKDYQLLLNRIGELERQLSFVPDDVQSLESEWQLMEAKLAELQQRNEELIEKQKEQKLALVEASERSKKYDRDLNEVTNSKEYNAVIKEIDAVRKRITSLNDDIAQRMVDLEENEANRNECKDLAKESKKKYQQALRKFRATQSELQGELDEKMAESESKVRDVPERLMKQFKRIADRRSGVGLALCVNSVCSACNVLVRQNVVDQIRHNKRVIQCDSCQRILYFHEEALTS